ncbi:MAG TPA: DNA phosphorothioation-dependent restriction protein DptG [Desulfosporosinus sp.]|nr:DNA phosphorothioation-dependent restriction protein DptG [Desulfosporosinus sp.]
MNIRLNFGELKKDFKFIDQESTGKFRLQHNTGKMIKVLPYKTKKPDAEDLTQFSGISGAFSRLLFNLKEKGDFKVKEVFDQILLKVQFERETDKSWFRNIIEELFLHHSEVEIFHPLLFNYLRPRSLHQSQIARFLCDVLVDPKTKNKVKATCSAEADNVLIRLMLESLPELEPMESTDAQYVSFLPFISGLFNADLSFMVSDTSFFVKDFDKLLEYYYFFYVSQLALKLDKMFTVEVAEPIPVYFNLDWEKTSKIRTSYIAGWAYLLPKIRSLFSHTITLEFINHSFGCEKILTYAKLFEEVQSMDDSERESFQHDVSYLLYLYKAHVEDVNWKDFSVTRKFEDPILDEIFNLQRAIEFQFTTSGRKSIPLKYANWFEKHSEAYFLKKRGPLGYTLNITQDFLIFFIRLSIKDRSKIKLKQLYKEFEKRGLFFDRDSKEHIIRLLEKLNLLEKKSDSGDAQYVKSIL